MLFNEFIGFRYGCGVRASLENIAYYPYHTHNQILETVCVLDGDYRITNGALEHELSYGDVYFFNSPDTHKIQRVSDNGIILTVHTDLNYYKSFFSDYDGSGQYDLSSFPYFICDSYCKGNRYSVNIKYLRFLMARLYMEYSADSPSLHNLESCTEDFIRHILDYYQDFIYTKQDNGKYGIVQRNATQGVGITDDRIYRISDYMDRHASEKITLEDIASREYLSPNYLSTYIRKAMGLSFSELLSAIRCEHAETLLGMTSKNLDEIASEVGLSNRSHLTNQFRKWFDKTPSQYRRELKSDLSSDSIKYDSFDFDYAMMIINSYLDGY